MAAPARSYWPMYPRSARRSPSAGAVAGAAVLDGFGFLGIFGTMKMDLVVDANLVPRELLQHNPGRPALEARCLLFIKRCSETKSGRPRPKRSFARSVVNDSDHPFPVVQSRN